MVQVRGVPPMATITARTPPVTTDPTSSREGAPWRTTISAFVKRHPVLTYYVLTFAISWGGVLLVIGGIAGLPGTPEQIERLMPLVILFMLFGPSVAGLLLTGLVDGRAGYRGLLSRLLRWRVGLRWYAVALLTGPLVYTVVLLALSLTSPVFLPGIVTTSDKASFLLVGTAPGILVGLLEEVGWTGFAIPRLRLRYGALTTGLIAGVLWGAWHILTNDLWGAGVSAGAVPLTLYMIVSAFTFLVGQLPAYRVLMVWVYDRTGSLLVAVLMHASLVFSTFVLGPNDIAGVPILAYGLGVGAGMWVIVAAVAMAKGGQLSREPQSAAHVGRARAPGSAAAA